MALVIKKQRRAAIASTNNDNDFRFLGLRASTVNIFNERKPPLGFPPRFRTVSSRFPEDGNYILRGPLRGYLLCQVIYCSPLADNGHFAAIGSQWILVPICSANQLSTLRAST